MKQKILEILAAVTMTPSVRFNKAFELYRSSPGASQASIVSYNRGFSPNELKNLLYDLQKLHGITDLQIRTYVPVTEIPDEVDEQSLLGNTDSDLVIFPLITEANIAEADLEHQKIRDAFPFLTEETCPDILKVLVADKITYWTKLQSVRQELDSLVETGKNETTVQRVEELSGEAVKLFEAEQIINDELVHYNETKELLGKHPKMKLIAMENEIKDKDVNELHKLLKNAASYISKQQKALLEEGLTEEKKELIQGRLEDRELLSNFIKKKLGLDD